MICVLPGHIFTDNITYTDFPFPSQYYLPKNLEVYSQVENVTLCALNIWFPL